MSRVDTRDLVDYPVVEGQHVLSVYLQTHSAESLTVFNTRTATIRRQFEKQVEQNDFNECVDRVRKFLTRFEARAETVVIICNSAGPLWVRQMDIVLPNEVRWDREPYWKPSVEALDEFEPYGVVEKFKARLLTMSVSGIQEHRSLQRTSEDLDGFSAKADFGYPGTYADRVSEPTYRRRRPRRSDGVSAIGALGAATVCRGIGAFLRY